MRTKADLWRPTVEGDGSLCWPVVLAYPEAGMAQDTIEEFHESALISQHLDVVGGLPWLGVLRLALSRAQVYALPLLVLIPGLVVFHEYWSTCLPCFA